MKKRNCWEFKKCGREQGGENSLVLGVCPAATTIVLDRVHGGTKGGRACWVVAGTMCEGEVQGTFAQKYRNCANCDFYKLVRDEEGGGFQMTIRLLTLVQD